MFTYAMCLTEVKVNGTWWLSGLAGSTIHAASHGVEGLLGVRCGCPGARDEEEQARPQEEHHPQDSTGHGRKRQAVWTACFQRCVRRAVGKRSCQGIGKAFGAQA